MVFNTLRRDADILYIDTNKITLGGAMDAVMTVLRTHMNHVGATAQACGALWNIAVNGIHI